MTPGEFFADVAAVKAELIDRAKSFPRSEWVPDSAIQPLDAEKKHMLQRGYYGLRAAVVGKIAPRKVAMIGVRYGYGIMCFANAMTPWPIEVHGWDNEAMGITLEHAREVLDEHLPMNAAYFLHMADSTTLEDLEGGPFDLVYVDGAKDKSTVANDVALAFKAIAEDGIVMVDDTKTPSVLAGVRQAAIRCAALDFPNDLTGLILLWRHDGRRDDR